MIGEIHLTKETMERLARDELSRDERRALLEHLNGSGFGCPQCTATEESTDEEFERFLTEAVRSRVKSLRRRAANGDREAERKLLELQFEACMRSVDERRARGGKRSRR